VDYLPAGNHTIIALETSATFHGLCEQRGRCHCVLSSMHQIDLPDASVDCVISLAGLHHLPDRDAFFQEAYRILKPGGNCCVADVAEKSCVARFLNDFVHLHNSMGHQGLFFDERAPNELEAAGFSITSSCLKYYHWQFSSPDDMCNYVRLLFGLDRAAPRQVLHGIETHLGWKQVPDACLMNWGLFFMKGIKPA
jgi:SAM-dependent methyltransferase